MFNPTLEAQYIRLYPVSYHRGCTLRFELLGCELHGESEMKLPVMSVSCSGATVETDPLRPSWESQLLAVCQSVALGILDGHFTSQYFCLFWFLVLLEQAVNSTIAGELSVFFVAVFPGPQKVGA